MEEGVHRLNNIIAKIWQESLRQRFRGGAAENFLPNKGKTTSHIKSDDTASTKLLCRKACTRRMPATTAPIGTQKVQRARVVPKQLSTASRPTLRASLHCAIYSILRENDSAIPVDNQESNKLVRRWLLGAGGCTTMRFGVGCKE